MRRVETLRLVGVPSRVASWFQTSVQLSGDDFYVPVWLILDAMGVRYPAMLGPIKFDVAVDARNRKLVLAPLPHAPGMYLRETEHRVHTTRYKFFRRVRLRSIREIFQLGSPVRFPVAINREHAALIVNLRREGDAASCIRA